MAGKRVPKVCFAGAQVCFEETKSVISYLAKCPVISKLQRARLATQLHTRELPRAAARSDTARVGAS